MNLIVDLIGASAWPLVVLLIAKFLKTSINSLLDALSFFIKKQSDKDLKSPLFSTTTVQKQNKEIKITENELVESIQPAQDQTIRNIRENQHVLVKKYIPLVETQIQTFSTDAVRIEALTSAYVEYYITTHFERVYVNIFGSQLYALRSIEDNGGHLPEESSRMFYEEAKTKFPEMYSNFTFDTWLLFLIQNDLIERADSTLILKDEGKVFLDYIRSRSYMNYYKIG